MKRKRGKDYFLKDNLSEILCKMRNLKYLLPLFFVWLASCTSEPLRVVEETWPNGSPKTVKFFSNDSKKVLLKEVLYYEDSTKRQEGEYKNGERTGLWTYWYPNGNKWSQGVYENGIENGLKTTWYENGQKYYEGNLKDGNRVGLWKFWDKDGKLLKQIDYSKR